MGRRGALALLASAAALAAVLLRASDTLSYAWMAVTDPDSIDFSQVGLVLRCRCAAPSAAWCLPQLLTTTGLILPRCSYLSRPRPGRCLYWGMHWPRAGCRSCRPLCCHRTSTWSCSPLPLCPPKVR